MCLGVNTWFRYLVFFILFACPLDVFASLLGAYNYQYTESTLRKLQSEAAKSGMSDLPLGNCSDHVDLTLKSYGDKNKSKKDDVITGYEKGRIVRLYGSRGRYFGSIGFFDYVEWIDLNIPSPFVETLLSGYKSALKAGNCDIAQSILDAMINGKVDNHPDIGPHVTFSNGTDKCVVDSNGGSSCAFNKIKYDENGNPRIEVCGQENCDRATLDEYASGKDRATNSGNNSGNNDNPNPKDPNTGNNSGNNDNNGSAGDNNSNGQGSGSTAGQGSGAGTGQGNGADNGQGSGAGTGGGSGSGNGDGKGEDKDGKDEETSVNIFDAPSMSSAFLGLRQVIRDKFLSEISVGSGECLKVSLSLMGRHFEISTHCEILEAIADQFAALMMFLYSFAAVRIVLSA